MDTLPLFLNLTGQPCLVVGAGPVALRKVETLIAAGADVEVVAPEIAAPLESILLRNNAKFSQRKFNSRDVKNRLLVIAATGSAKTNKAVFDACQRAHVLINTVDDPAHCTAVFPSIVDRSPVTIAVSTGATSPSLGRRVRAQIEAMLPANYGRLARFLGERRIRVRDVIDDQTARQRFWDEVLDSIVPDLVLQGRDTDAGDAFDAKLHARAVPTGFVSLVGAGPGDPDLLTLKALRCLQRADIVYHDNLVSPGVLALCRRDAERVYVGKRRAFHSTRQEEINKLLLDGALAGKRVVRLKGGDPFIFGRGGEEIESLAAEGVAFEIVPGITAALGCAAYAGIPLTHRDWAQSVRFVTGHLQNDVVNLDWPELAKPDQTLVIYMGLRGLEQVCRKLVEHGMDPATPAALISRGTYEDQQVIESTLAGLAENVDDTIPGPTTTIIGRVVALRAKLQTVGRTR